MIPLYVYDGTAYVWNSDDWQTLRVNHRICGALIGTVPSFPRQNDFQGKLLLFALKGTITKFANFIKGVIKASAEHHECTLQELVVKKDRLDSAFRLPMALMTEEAVLLVKKGICELIELPSINNNLSEEQKLGIKEAERKILEEQADALRKRKIDQLSQKIDIILAGKKQKLISQGIFNANIDKETLLQEEINKLPKLAPAHVLVHLPTEHFINKEHKKSSIDVLKPSVFDREGSTCYAIFKDLWEKGHYITSGSKFGADYLVYPGDPVKFHAMYMLRCVNDDALFRPANLVAFGRLSVAVNKLAVLAFKNTGGKIEYQTLQWHDSVHG